MAAETMMYMVNTSDSESEACDMINELDELLEKYAVIEPTTLPNVVDTRGKRYFVPNDQYLPFLNVYMNNYKKGIYSLVERKRKYFPFSVYLKFDWKLQNAELVDYIRKIIDFTYQKLGVVHVNLSSIDVHASTKKRVVHVIFTEALVDKISASEILEEVARGMENWFPIAMLKDRTDKGSWDEIVKHSIAYKHLPMLGSYNAAFTHSYFPCDIDYSSKDIKIRELTMDDLIRGSMWYNSRSTL